MKPRHFTPLIAIVLASQSALALDGSWSLLTGGNASGAWGTASNWTSSNIASGTDATATFNLDITANSTLTLDAARNVGTLVFTDATTASHDWILSTGTSGSLVLDSSTAAGTINVTNRTATISANISGNDTEGLIKTGTGTLVLSGTNSYTGVTTVGSGTATAAGVVNVSGDQSAANGGWSINGTSTVNFLSGSTITLGAGKVISFANGGNNNNRVLNVAGTVNTSSTSHLSVNGGDTINLNSGANWTQNGNLTIQPLTTFTNAQITVNTDATFTYAGSSAISLTHSISTNGGSGTLSIAGGTFVTGQGFVSNSSGTVGSANLLLSNAGTLKLTANVTTLASGTSTRPFNVQVGTGGGIIDTNGFTTSIAQGIVNVSGQTGSLTKRGAGTLTLNGANSYTGSTQVEQGTLALGAAGTISSTLVLGTSVGGTGTLDVTSQASFTQANVSGKGTLNIGAGRTINVTSSFGPGFSPGTINVTGNLSLVNGTNNTVTTMELAGLGGAAGTDYDFANVSGTLTLDGILNIISDNGYDLNQAASYNLFDAATGFTGDFDSVSVGGTSLSFLSNVWTGSSGQYNYQFNETDGVLNITAVPEPSAALLGALGALALLRRRRN